MSGPADPSAARRRCTAILLLALLLASPASAVYAMDGVALHTAVHGKRHGTVSVSGGHGLAPSPYSQSFTVPAGTVTVHPALRRGLGRDARLRGRSRPRSTGRPSARGRWGAARTGTARCTVSGYGVHWSAYDVTARVRAGANSAIATTAGDIDGRIYGMLLAVATEDSSAPGDKVLVRRGERNLNAAGKKDAAALSLGGGPLPSSVTAGRLHVAYLASTRGDGDRLLFNGKEIATDAAGASSSARPSTRGRTTSPRSPATRQRSGSVAATWNRLHPVFVAYVATLVGEQRRRPRRFPRLLPGTDSPSPRRPRSRRHRRRVPPPTTTTGAAPVPAATTATTAATATTLSATVTAVTTASPATTPPTATNAATTTVATTATTAPTLTDAPTPTTCRRNGFGGDARGDARRNARPARLGRDHPRSDRGSERERRHRRG